MPNEEAPPVLSARGETVVAISRKGDKVKTEVRDAISLITRVRDARTGAAIERDRWPTAWRRVWMPQGITLLVYPNRDKVTYHTRGNDEAAK